MNKKINYKQIGLLILSSYERSHLWHEITRAWNKYNTNLKLKKYISSDFSKKKKINGFKIITNNLKDKNWSQKHLFNLQNIKEKNIILSLDDFLIFKLIDENNIYRSLNFYFKKKLNYLRLTPSPPDLKNSKDAIYLVPNFAYHKINLQISIWKNSFLKKCLKNSTNPWNFETRNSYDYKKRKIYTTSYWNFLYFEIINKSKLTPFLPKQILKNKIFKKIEKKNIFEYFSFFLGLLKFKILYLIPIFLRYKYMQYKLDKKY